MSPTGVLHYNIYLYDKLSSAVLMYRKKDCVSKKAFPGLP